MASCPSQTVPHYSIYDFLIPPLIEVMHYLAAGSKENEQSLTSEASSISFKLMIIGEIKNTIELKDKLLTVWQNHPFYLANKPNFNKPKPSTESETNINETKNNIPIDDSSIDSLTIENISIAQFLQLPFHNRYDLGVFIHPDLFHLQLGDAINNSKESDKLKFDYRSSDYKNAVYKKDHSPALTIAQLNSIAIRLRDLFAKQSLLFMPSASYLDAYESSITTPPKTEVLNNPVLQFNDLGYTILAATSHPSLNTLPLANPPIVCWQFNLYDYKPRPDWLNAKYWANPENFNKFRW